MARGTVVAVALVGFIFAFGQANYAQQDGPSMCDNCKGKVFTAVMSSGKICGHVVSHGGADYCPDCGKKMNICYVCGKALGGGKIAPSPANGEQAKSHIDLVIAIDVSGSMEQIIAAAQKKIWTIINQMASAKPSPALRIGLIAYRGENEECYGGKGFKVWDLSDDLDKVYQQLMGLKTDNGERECVGRAIYEAANSMNWEKSKGTLRVMFILGNEPANQDSDQQRYGYKVASTAAIKNDININTIYCAQSGEGATPEWKEIAQLADGSFAVIGLEGRIVEIPTPMDAKLVDLNTELNKTYLSYGRAGKEKAELQVEMDKAAGAVGGASNLAQRAQAKGGEGYNNEKWDLVDAAKKKDFKLDDIKDEELPEELKKLSPEERKAFIDTKAKERKEVQEKIVELGKERDAYIKAELKKQKPQGDEFDQVILKTLQRQGEKKGFKFQE